MKLDPTSLTLLHLCVLPLLGLPCVVPGAGTFPVVLKKGDHVCRIGNALAERIRHDGEFESRLQARFPGHELVFRKLGFAADTLGIREAVLDKNAKWFDRCRVTDGFNVYGGRSQRRCVENVKEARAEVADRTQFRTPRRASSASPHKAITGRVVRAKNRTLNVHAVKSS